MSCGQTSLLPRGRKTLSKGGAAALLLLSLLLLTLPGSSQEGSLERKLKVTRANLQEERARLRVMNDRARDVSVQLGQTQARLGTVQAKLEETRARLAAAQERLAALKAQIEATRARLLKAQRALERRLQQIYLTGDVNYLSVLLEAASFTDFLNQSEYLERIVQSDQKLIGEVRARKLELEVKKAAAQKTVSEIASTEKLQARQAKELARVEARRAALLHRVREQRDQVQDKVVELEHLTVEMEAELQAMIRARQAESRGGGGPPRPSAGVYVMPVSGWITSNFGYRIHPIRGTSIFHAGLDIAAGSGTPIKAADNGRVIHSGWYGGYGNTIIIDHGDGYSTLYAHCSALYAGYGQAVNQGQVVAAVGSTGMSTGPHLHFEVRYQGDPVDPRGRL